MFSRLLTTDEVFVGPLRGGAEREVPRIKDFRGMVWGKTSCSRSCLLPTDAWNRLNLNRRQNTSTALRKPERAPNRENNAVSPLHSYTHLNPRFPVLDRTNTPTCPANESSA